MFPCNQKCFRNHYFLKESCRKESCFEGFWNCWKELEIGQLESAYSSSLWDWLCISLFCWSFSTLTHLTLTVSNGEFWPETEGICSSAFRLIPVPLYFLYLEVEPLLSIPSLHPVCFTSVKKKFGVMFHRDAFQVTRSAAYCSPKLFCCVWGKNVVSL